MNRNELTVMKTFQYRARFRDLAERHETLQPPKRGPLSTYQDLDNNDDEAMDCFPRAVKSPNLTALNLTNTCCSVV
jgi:hypothetical protein